MRLLDICHVYPPEHAPAGVQARDFAEDLTRMGHEVTVLTGWPNHPGGRLHPGWKVRFREASRTDAGFALVRCGHSIHRGFRMLSRLFYYLTFAASTFVNGLFCGRPDVVFCESTPIFGPIAALLLARLRGAKFVYRIHDVHPEAALNAGLIRVGLAYRLLRGLDSWVCRRADLVLPLTDGMRRCLLARGLPADRVVVARQWFDGGKVTPGPRDNSWRRAQGIPTDQFVVLYAGTIGYISGAQVVVEAAALLRHRSEILFLFVGDGPVKEECRRLAESRGLTQVRFLPFQPAKMLSEVQATADVGLVTLLDGSGDTSVPSKVHGYTAAGRPVVASVRADSATAETVAEGDFGTVVPPGDAGELAKAIVSLADERELAARLGANARRFFASRFDRSSGTARLEEILAVDVCGERLAGAAGLEPAVLVRPATSADLARIVAVHASAFPGVFLTALGPAFLRAYYRAVLDFDAGCMLVAELDGRVAGFVAGFADPRRFYAVFRRRPLAFAPAVLAGLLRRPWLIGRIVARVGSVLHRGRDERQDSATGAACELSSLAVDPRARRRGIGQKLVATFVAEARGRGLDVVRLTTDARGNDRVNDFYAGLGFQLVPRPAEGARPMNEYELPLWTRGLRHAG
jgi:colanic acid biosynthesis glycosyl transferase WcaI